MISQAVILCGGKGTRLGALVSDIPKPMLPIAGIPLLDRTLQLLKRHGISDVILAAGHKADVIRQHYERGFDGITVSVYVEAEPRGTAGAVRMLAEQLDDDFLLVYGDVFLDFDIGALARDHEANTAAGTLLVRPSDHPWDSDLVVADDDGLVTRFLNKHRPQGLYKNLANAAIYALSKRIVEFIPEHGSSDFVKEVFPAALEHGVQLRTHLLEPGGFVKDMGTPERLAKVEEYLRWQGLKTQARAQRGPIATVFLDRDGVLNIDKDLVKSPTEVELLPGAAEGLRLLNEAGLKTIIVTNQPVVARGLCTLEGLDAIHARLRDLLAQHHARFDALYYCPHHPETHHSEGVMELRRACDCRKPAIGMIMHAAEELSLDLGRAVMVGDSSVDIETGVNAGIRTILLTTGAGRVDEATRPDYTFRGLKEAALAIVSGEIR
jgi:histidinol-phosphate phosphatase family protein